MKRCAAATSSRSSIRTIYARSGWPRKPVSAAASMPSTRASPSASSAGARRPEWQPRHRDQGGYYQPPPPPPPPPPPDDPPPPEPLLDPGAVEADETVLASDEPI